MENLPKKVRSKKLSTRVDLTAMVSISFLLIIFFMVTIELAKPKVMEYGYRGGCGPEPECNKPDENRNLVDILDEMKITGIKSYSIVDYYTPEESKLLASK